MKNLTAKETALELALRILYSVIPSKEASDLMEQMGKIVNHPQSKPLAKENFDKANSIYQSLDPNKARHIMIVDNPSDLAKFQEFRDCLLAISNHISEYQYLVTVEGWSASRELKFLASGNLGFQLTICRDSCPGCKDRVREAEQAVRAAGVEPSLFQFDGNTWIDLPALKVGDINKYLEVTLGIKIVRISKA